MFTEDLSPFFDPADLGTAAVFTHVGGSATAVNGIFDEPSHDAFSAIQDQQPSFLCAATSVPLAARNDTLVIGARTFKIQVVEPDGTGLVRLKLQLQ